VRSKLVGSEDLANLTTNWRLLNREPNVISDHAFGFIWQGLEVEINYRMPIDEL